MTPFLADPDVTLYQGDALETLRELPDRSVDMVATSPPFYGLRDYGTGLWDGGDPDCDHVERKAGKQGGDGNTLGRDASHPNRESLPATGHALIEIKYRSECGKCGARRVDRQIGLEETPDEWVANLVAVFRECRRVLADHGTLWVEIGDSYTSSGNGGDTKTGFNARYFGNEDLSPGKQGAPEGQLSHRRPGKPKDLLGQPWMLAFALRADGWYLRSEIIWARPNPMPESVTDRPTKAHSTVFLLSKQPRYFYDADAIREPFAPTLANGAPNPRARYPGGLYPNETTQERYDKPAEVRTFSPREPDDRAGANARSVWQIPTEPTPFAHFATWPRKLIARMIQAGTSERGKCPECGKPWQRKVERALVATRGHVVKGRKDDERTAAQVDVEDGRSERWNGTPGTPYGRHEVTTVGWCPSCECGPAAVTVGTLDAGEGFPLLPLPCVVLDPFAGSGTTLLTARHHGRHSIGIELNPDYCALAADRLAQLSLLTG